MKSKAPIEIIRNENSNNLYVFFGGIAAGIAMPVFEFYNASKILDENRIFVRDFDQCWYHTGLPEISSDIKGTAEYLKKEIEAIQPEKIFFVGNSMGGFAAILFSQLLNLDNVNVIAFAPQTSISPWFRLVNRDRRWRKQIRKTHFKSFSKTRCWDVKKMISGKTKISIFVSSDDRCDLIHARHLKGMKNVHVHEFEKGGHAIAKHLKEQGLLAQIMSGNYS